MCIMIGGLSMKRRMYAKKIALSFGLLCFTLLMPLLVPYNTVSAASWNTSASNTEEKPPAVKLNVKKKSLVTDTSYTLQLYNLKDSYKITFKSSDSDIASVDSKEGIVTALKVGTATITITVKEGTKTIQTLTCEIIVGVPAVSIKFKTISSISLEVGKSTWLETILTPNNTVENPKFSSKDPSVATVSSSGRITAKSVGTTCIRGTIGNGQFAEITVEVTDESKTPTVSPAILPSFNY